MLGKDKVIELWKTGNLRIITLQDSKIYRVKDGITEEELLEYYDKYPLSFAENGHITLDDKEFL